MEKNKVKAAKAAPGTTGTPAGGATDTGKDKPAAGGAKGGASEQPAGGKKKWNV